MALTPDSLRYLAAAKNLAEGHGLRGYDNLPFVTWPPLLPMVLALLQSMGIEMVHGLRWFYALINALVLGFSVCWISRCGMLSRIGREHPQQQDGPREVPSWAAFLFAATVVCLLPQLRVAATVWSELLFIALELTCLYAAVAASIVWNIKAVAVAVVAAGFACLSRYSAVSLLLACTTLFLFVGNGSFGRRLKRSLIFGLAASIPLALWLVRNWYMSGTLTGPRHVTEFGLGKSITMVGVSIPKLFVSAKTADLLSGHVWLLIFVMFWAGVFWYSLQSVLRNPLTFRRVSRLALVLYLGWFFVVLVAAFTTIAMDVPNDRLWAPIMLPSLILLGLFLEKKHSWRSWTATLLLAVVMISGATRLPGRIERFQEKDAVYALARWQHSELVQYLRTHPLKGAVLSNQPAFLHYMCGIQAEFTPLIKNYNSKNTWIQRDELFHFESVVKRGGGAHIVWFNESKRYLFPLKVLQKYYPIHSVTKVADGEILFVSDFQGSAVPPPKKSQPEQR